MFDQDRADFIASFDEYDLLVIDDLGEMCIRDRYYTISFHVCGYDRENQGKIKVLSNAKQSGGYMI